MKVLLVNGSPHKNGCTYTALCEVSKSLNQNEVDTDIFWIGTKPIAAARAVTVAIRKINAYSMTRLMNSWKLPVIMTDLYSVRRFTGAVFAAA